MKLNKILTLCAVAAALGLSADTLLAQAGGGFGGGGPGGGGFEILTPLNSSSRCSNARLTISARSLT